MEYSTFLDSNPLLKPEGKLCVMRFFQFIRLGWGYQGLFLPLRMGICWAHKIETGKDLSLTGAIFNVFHYFGV